MRPLVGELLLEAWERGAVETDLNRPLALLAAARGEAAHEHLAGLSLADRDVRLLRLRRLTFGDMLRGGFRCGSCAAFLEFEMSVTSMLEQLGQAPAQREIEWSAGNVNFLMRAVTTRDLLGIAPLPDPRRKLLERCLSVKGGDAESALETHQDVAVEQFNRVNEHAETRLKITCPACGVADQVELDIGQFLWADVRRAALRVMRDVHDLACAYGWPEREI